MINKNFCQCIGLKIYRYVKICYIIKDRYEKDKLNYKKISHAIFCRMFF